MLERSPTWKSSEPYWPLRELPLSRWLWFITPLETLTFRRKPAWRIAWNATPRYRPRGRKRILTSPPLDRPIKTRGLFPLIKLIWRVSRLKFFTASKEKAIFREGSAAALFFLHRVNFIHRFVKIQVESDFFREVTNWREIRKHLNILLQGTVNEGSP